MPIAKYVQLTTFGDTKRTAPNRFKAHPLFIEEYRWDIIVSRINIETRLLRKKKEKKSIEIKLITF